MKPGQIIRLVKSFATGNGHFKKGQAAKFMEEVKLSGITVLKFKTTDERTFAIPIDKQEKYFKMI